MEEHNDDRFILSVGEHILNFIYKKKNVKEIYLNIFLK